MTDESDKNNTLTTTIDVDHVLRIYFKSKNTHPNKYNTQKGNKLC
jgi:hypothetical protein